MNVTANETRVAFIDGHILQELHVERATTKNVIGNVYLGKVVRVLEGMQAAFVDIGLEKAAFLQASEIVVPRKNISKNDKDKFKKTDISDLVRAGQEIIVQVVKAPTVTKGACVSSDIKIASRYLVFAPNSKYVAVSQRIKSETERNRLTSIIEEYLSSLGGFIIRTGAQKVFEQALRQDAVFLQGVWTKVLKRTVKADNKNRLLYAELMLPLQILRDFADIKIEKIRVDSETTHKALLTFTNAFIPELNGKVHYYSASLPIFEFFDIENEIGRSLERKVNLKSGGYIVIDQTEAMTTIDINTGGFVGHRHVEDTIFNTNIEATKTIAQQLRLRNLGGIIILDFINMKSIEHQRRVFLALKQALAKDRIKTHIYDFSPLGLIEMTRKRTNNSLEEIFCERCTQCQGRGAIKTVETVCYEILREILRVNNAFSVDKFDVYTSSSVACALESNRDEHLQQLILSIAKEVKIHAKPLYSHEQFDVVVA